MVKLYLIGHRMFWNIHIKLKPNVFEVVFQVDHIVDLYKNVFQSTVSLVHARISSRSTGSLIIIQSEWRQRNLERGSSIKILRTALSDESLKSCIEISAIDVSHWYVLLVTTNNCTCDCRYTLPDEGYFIKLLL